MSFVSVVPIIVPLCSIYLWCNQNVFKRILQWTNTIYSGRFNASTTNCSLGIFAKSLDGLPRAWVRIPPTPPTMAIGSRRNLRAFLFFGAMMVQLVVFWLFRGKCRIEITLESRMLSLLSRVIFSHKMLSLLLGVIFFA